MAVLVGVAASLSGCAGGVETRGVTSPPATAVEPEVRDSAPVGPPVGGSTVAEADVTGAEAQAADPSRVRIPAIGVDAPIIPLGLRDDGRIEVPVDFDATGWWADGPEPGETGPAVILGHVDSREGPAVFFDLPRLDPGDRILIDRLDGSTVTYLVERIEEHPKDAFPTEAVYGPTSEPVLRLITCGGVFDNTRRSYEDNIIVFARLADR